MMNRRDAPLPDEAAVAELIRAIGRLVRRLRADTNPGELSLSQAGALARLDENGWMTTADLARAEHVKPQSMGATLAALEQEGLVQRRPHPTDGRQVLFGLTDEGRATRRRRALLKREWLSAAVAKLDPEERRALFAAVPLIERLGEP